MTSVTSMPTAVERELLSLAERLQMMEEHLREAQQTIALLDDRLAWAEAELAEQAAPFAPARSLGAVAAAIHD